MVRNYTNITSVQDFVLGANTGSGGAFWGFTIYMMFVVLVGIMSRFGFVRSVLTASVICVILAMPLVIIDALGMIWMAPLLGFALLTIIYTAFSSRE